MMSAEAATAAITTKRTPARHRVRRWGAPQTIVAVAVALVAMIVGIFVMLCIQGYASTIASAEKRGQTAADVVAEGTSWVIAAGRATIEAVEASLGDDPTNASSSTLAAFQDISRTIPAQVALGLYDAEGNLIVRGSSPNAHPSIADKDYFRTILDGAAWTLSAQEKDPQTGEPQFAVIKRLGPSASPAGVAMIMIDAEVLEGIAEAQDIGEQSSISIVRDDGWVIARHPPLADPLNVGDRPMFARLNSGESGSYTATSIADGVERIVSFRRVDDLGYIAVAAISVDATLAGLWNSIWIVSWLIAPIALALLVGSLITARVMRRTQMTSQSLADALAHNDVLFREIHHRVKNNLQAINSLLQLHPIPRDVRADMSRRIAAMSAVHEHIYGSHTFARVQVKDYLLKLIENIRGGNNPAVQVNSNIEDVAVDKDAATPLGLIVNEVVSNAFKHAFVDGRAGTIDIALVGEGDTARLTVRDNGVGFDPQAPGKGIGRRLITGLTAQLHGESSQVSDAEGSTFTLTFPLARD